ncbi:hypothetical protein GCM10027036_15100 [Flavihumibacter cheonanensis]
MRAGISKIGASGEEEIDGDMEKEVLAIRGEPSCTHAFWANIRAGMINNSKSTSIRLMNKWIVWTAYHSVD